MAAEQREAYLSRACCPAAGVACLVLAEEHAGRSKVGLAEAARAAGQGEPPLSAMLSKQFLQSSSLARET